MRVVAGRFRGRALAGPADDRVRPTSDRVREAMFNILEHGIAGFSLAGIKVLDLYAGTGALGIEAISRGAAFALLIDDHSDSRGVIRRNVEALGLTGATKIFRRDAADLGPAGRNDGFSLVFIDPPYGQGLGEKALASAIAGGWLLPGAVIVIEEAREALVRLPPGVTELDRREWGGTQAIFAQLGPSP